MNVSGFALYDRNGAILAKWDAVPARVDLPNGDIVFSAAAGWQNDSYRIDAATWIEPDPVPAPVTEVTPRQARLALSAAGLLDQVNSAIAGMPAAAQITWQFASTINRADPLIAQLGPTLGLSEQQIDQLFAQAATL